jgi:hypothetical protein
VRSGNARGLEVHMSFRFAQVQPRDGFSRFFYLVHWQLQRVRPVGRLLE